jgi:two-component system sensor histidine kinase BaeS
VVGADELGQLARSFNTMADSLAESAARQRRQIADVAHELRTPLANLRGYLEALSDGVLTPDPALFSSLHEEALLQQRLVDDLHELALAEAGALSYHRTPTDLRELAAACRQAHAAAADAAGVTLTGPEPLGGTRTGPEPLGGTEPAAGERGDTADVDPDRLRQVVGNLLSNAVRATPAGGRVTIRVGRDGDTARIEVDDTGSGIDQADLPYVFDRFWRADPARTRGGSGLGLAVARQIVTDHGGTLTATSSPGAGSTFRVTLPALDPTGQSV